MMTARALGSMGRWEEKLEQEQRRNESVPRLAHRQTEGKLKS